MAAESQNWVWITKKEFYLDEDGQEADHLDPASGFGSDGSWWTCHPDTRAGDLVLLYRTAPKSDVAYLLEAASTARRLGAGSKDSVVTMREFPHLIEKAKAAEVAAGKFHSVRQTIMNYDNAVEQQAAALEAMSRYGWNPEDLDEAEAAHGELEGVLIDREKSEGLAQVQADWDAWSQQADDLGLVKYYVEDWSLANNRQDLAFEVFEALDMPYETVLETDSDFKGRWVCDWEPRYMFTNPVPLGTFRDDSWLSKNWNALRADFKGSHFRFDPHVWNRVLQVASGSGNQDLRAAVDLYSRPGPSVDIVMEYQIRDALADNPSALDLGDLSMYVDPLDQGRRGVEYVCSDVGLIDLLLTDQNGDMIVVELKRKRAGEAVIGQIAKYIGWVQQNLAGGRSVRGVVVSDGYDAKYEAAAPLLSLTHIEVSDVKDRLGL